MVPQLCIRWYLELIRQVTSTQTTIRSGTPFWIPMATISNSGKESIMDRKEYHNAYLKRLKEVRFRVTPEEFVEYEAAAARMGYRSMRQFIMAAISEKN